MSHTIERILDANLNRAREALRVIEEYVRFLIPDSSHSVRLFRRLKAFRHGVADLARRFGSSLTHARDVGGDRGSRADERGKKTRRADEVTTANAKRLQESLRAIEEYAKVVDVAASNEAGRMRFEAYRIEQELEALDLRARLGRARLYVLLSSDVARDDIVRVAAAAARGGADVIQLREEGVSDRRLIARARAVGAVCRERGVIFIVNDRADVAAAVGAGGVHLGGDDMTIADARRILGGHRIIGATSHNLREAEQAVRAGADYVSVGPMFPSPTKPGLAAGGFAYVGAAARRITIPFFCIGGIDAGNVKRVLAAGGRRVAVCASVISARDVASAARRLKTILTNSL